MSQVKTARMSQVKTARIEDVLNEKPWDGKHGRVWYYTLVLDNGDKGEIGTKTRDSFSINDSLTYTVEDTDHGRKLKKVNPEYDGQQGGGGSQQQQQQAAPARNFGGGRGSEASFALSYAKDFIGKAMEVRKTDEVSVNQWVEAVLVTADKFNRFLKENA